MNMRIFSIILAFFLITGGAQAKKVKIFNSQSFMRVLDSTCIAAKFDKKLFKIFTAKGFAVSQKLSPEMLSGMMFSDLGYSVVVSREDYRNTGILYIISMGDNTARPKTRYCTISISLNAGNALSGVLQNNYNAKLIADYKQGLSNIKMLVVNLTGYGQRVIFSIQHSKVAATTIFSMFYAPKQ